MSNSQPFHLLPRLQGTLLMGTVLFILMLTAISLNFILLVLYVQYIG